MDCRMTRNTRHAGFTLVEAMVVLAVIGLLISILLPAVAHVRESSRRADCANRLKQFGIALHARQSATGQFPSPMPGRSFQFGDYWATDREFSGYYDLLPHLDLIPLFNAINLGSDDKQGPTYTPDTPENRTIYETRIVLFLCPSDALPAKAPPSAVSYRFNVGGSSPVQAAFRDPSRLGAFDPVRPAGPQAYRDGLANTAGLSERVVGTHQDARFDPRRDFWKASLPGWIAPGDDDKVLRICHARSNEPLWPESKLGESWTLAGNFYTWYNHVAPPNDAGSDCDTNDWQTGDASWCENCSMTARAFHDAGVHVLVMDGSVRFVSNSISLPVWRAFGTRAGSEAVELP